VIAVAIRAGGQRREIRPAVGLTHANAPGGFARQHLGQVAIALVGRPERDERRPHLPIGEPGRGDRRAGGDERLAHQQSLDRRTASAPELDRPRHADPIMRRELSGELARVPAQPRVVEPSVARHRIGGDAFGFGLQGQQLVTEAEVHQVSLPPDRSL
jgi:hypothetical protein